MCRGAGGLYHPGRTSCERYTPRHAAPNARASRRGRSGADRGGKRMKRGVTWRVLAALGTAVALAAAVACGRHGRVARPRRRTRPHAHSRLGDLPAVSGEAHRQDGASPQGRPHRPPPQEGAAARLLRRLAQPALRPRLRPEAHRPARGQHRHELRPARGGLGLSQLVLQALARLQGPLGLGHAVGHAARPRPRPRAPPGQALLPLLPRRPARAAARATAARRPRCRTATGSCATATRTGACCSGTATTSAGPTATL